MIRIHPSLSYAPRCPICDEVLAETRVRITGMRNLAEGRCTSCDRLFYSDLPAGHALVSPITVDAATGEVFDPTECSWFSEPLRRSALARDDRPVPISVTRRRDADEIILVNCLDYLYGHSLLKLLNVQQHLDRTPELGVCVLIPKQFAHLVPDGVAELWAVDLPQREMLGWYTSIEDFVRGQIQSRRACYLSFAFSHPHPSRYDIRRFVGNGDDPGAGDLVRFVFSYREDRLWGKSLSDQRRRLLTLHHLLSAYFPRLDFTLIGFGKPGDFGGAIKDLRVTRGGLETERSWLHALASAECAIGVHGSNMLLPTALAKHVIELLPEDRLGNELQALLFAERQPDAREALYRFRTLYGAEDLSDVSPHLVARVAATQVKRWDAFRTSMSAAHQPYDDAGRVVDPRPLVTEMQRIVIRTNTELENCPEMARSRAFVVRVGRAIKRRLRQSS